MLRVELRFPLGVYHALSPGSFADPEWPPSPVRLIGALLAAAHESPAIDTDTARELLARICAQPAPVIIAPGSAAIASGGVDDDAGPDGRTVVASIRGASRWAPRNHELGELKKSGLSPRNLGRERTEVYKGGTAIGEQSVAIVWAQCKLDPGETEVLDSLLAEVVYLGTTRSPVLATRSSLADDVETDAWQPIAVAVVREASVRVPDRRLLDAFDVRHDGRRSVGATAVQNAAPVPAAPLGRTVGYVRRSILEQQRLVTAYDPRHWGDMLILELDSETSEVWPKEAAAFLLSRAFREALLGAYTAIGTPGQAPPVLHGRGDTPHAAIVPLPFVGAVTERSVTHRQGRRVYGDGLIRGIAVVLPHERRLADVAVQRRRVEEGLLKFILPESRRWIALPDAGRVFLKLPNATRPLRTLREDLYRGPSRTWATVLPVVHAHKATSSGPRGSERQIEADLAHVDLPPAKAQRLTYSAIEGSPSDIMSPGTIPADWRGPLMGRRGHLHLEFDRLIVGPVILGRARHFGVGLCLPVGPATSSPVVDSSESGVQQ